MPLINVDTSFDDFNTGANFDEVGADISYKKQKIEERRLDIEKDLYPEEYAVKQENDRQNRIYDALTEPGQYMIESGSQQEQFRARKDNFDYGNDGDIVEFAKRAVNVITPDFIGDLNINKDGKSVNASNKKFNDMTSSEAVNMIKKAPEDPNGDKVIYYTKVPDGVDSTGKAHYTYKMGVADVSEYARYKDQFSKTGSGKLLFEKRVKDADYLEQMFHGSKGMRELRAFDNGMQEKVRSDEARRTGKEVQSSFGAGYTELYTDDVFQLGDITDEEILANEAKSKQAYLSDANTNNDFTTALSDSALNLGNNLVGLAGRTISGTAQEAKDNAISALVQEQGVSKEKAEAIIKDSSPLGLGEFIIRSGNNIQEWSRQNKEGNIAKFLGYKAKNTGKFEDIWSDLKRGDAGSVLTHLGQINFGELLGTQVVQNAAYMFTPTLIASIASDIESNIQTAEQNNDDKQVSNGRVGLIMATSTASALLEKLALKGIFGDDAFKAVKTQVDKAFPNLPQSTWKRVARTLGSSTVAFTAKTSVEASQEVAQAALETIGSDYKTDKYQTASKAFDSFKEKAGPALVGGYVVGGIMTSPSTLVQGAKGFSGDRILAVQQAFEKSMIKHHGEDSAKEAFSYYGQNKESIETQYKNSDLSKKAFENKIVKEAKAAGLSEDGTNALRDVIRTVHTSVKTSTKYEDLSAEDKASYDINKATVESELTKYEAEQRQVHLDNGITPIKAKRLAKDDALKARENLDTYAFEKKESDIFRSTDLSNKAGTIIRTNQTRINTGTQSNDTSTAPVLKEDPKGVSKDAIIVPVKALKDAGLDDAGIISEIVPRLEPMIAKQADKKNLTGKARETFIEQARTSNLNNINLALVQSGLGDLKKLDKIFDGSSIDLESIDNITNTDAATKNNHKTKEYAYLDDKELSNILDSENISNIGNSTKKKVFFDKARTKDYGEGFRILKSIAKKVNKTIGSSKEPVYDLLKDNNGDVSDSKIARLSSIAMTTIASSTKSEIDDAQDSQLKADSYGGRAENVYKVIGQKFLESYGVTLKGEDTKVYKDYAKIGEMAVSLLEEANIAKTEDGTVSKRKYVGKNGKPSRKNYSTGTGTTKETGHKAKVIYLIDTHPTNTKDRDYTFKTNEEYTRRISSLLLPTNQEIALTEPSTEVADTITGSAAIKAVKTLQKSPVTLKPYFRNMLKELKAKTKDIDMFNIKNLPTPIKVFLDIRDPLNYPESERNSINGKNNKRLQDLSNILDWFESLQEDGNGNMYFTYDQAINDRIHTIQTMFESQGDKYLSRQILGSSENIEVNTDTDAFKLLVATLAEDAGIEPNDVFGGNKEVDELVDQITNGVDGKVKFGVKNDNITAMTNMFTNFPNNSIIKKLTSKRPLLLAILGEISSIRNQLSKSVTKISTNYLTGTDAISSGVVNSLLNIIGRDTDKISNILKSVGIFKSENMTVDEMANDLYDYLNKSAGQVNKSINKAFDLLTKAGINKRELAKFPLMAFFYGQEFGSMRNDIQKTIYEGLIEHSVVTGDKSVIKEITGQENIDLATRELVEKWVDDNIGSAYETALGSAFSSIVEHKKDLEEIYNEMARLSGESPILIRSPLAVMSGDNDATIDIRKKKEVDIGKYADNIVMIASKLMPHAISAFVNPQHAIDGAILLKTVNDVSDKYKAEFGSVLTVHDAFYANPNISMKIMEEYNKNIVLAAKKYDIYSEMVNSLENMLQTNNKMPDSQKEVIQKIIDKHKTKSKSFRETKTDILNNELSDGIKGFAGASIDFDLDMSGKPTPPTNPTKPDINTETNTQENKAVKSTSTVGNSPTVDSATNTPSTLKEDNPFLDETSSVITVETLNKIVESAKLAMPGIDVFTNEADFKAQIEIDFKDNANIREQMIAGIDHNVANKNHFYALGSYVMINANGINNRDLRDNESMTEEKLQEIVMHEITHGTIDSWLFENQKSSEFKTIKRFTQHIKNYLAKQGVTWNTNKLGKATDVNYGNTLGSDKSIIDRMIYASSDVREATTIMLNEKSFADEIAKKLYSSKRASIWSNSLIDLFSGIINRIFNLANKKMVNTQKAMLSVLNKSLSKSASTVGSLRQERFLNYVEETNGDAQSNIVFGKDPFLFKTGNKYVKALVGSVFNKHTNEVIINGFKFIDKLGDSKLSTYSNVKKLINQEVLNSDLYTKMKAALGLSEDADKAQLSQMLSDSYAPQQEAMRVLEDDMVRLDNMIKDNYNKADKEKIYDLFGASGYGNLVLQEKVYARFLKGENINTIIETELEYLSRDPKVQDYAKKHIYGLAEYELNGINTIHKTSVGTIFKDEQQDMMTALVALKVIDSIPNGQEYISDMIKNKNDIYSELVIGSVANAQTTKKINRVTYGAKKDYDDYDGSGLKEIYEKDWEYTEVNERDMRTSKYSDGSGYVVVVEPNDAKHIKGVVAKEYDGLGFKDGVGLHSGRLRNGFNVTEIDIPTKMSENEYLERNNMVKLTSPTGFNIYKYVFPTDVKINKLGMQKDVAKALWMATSQNSLLSDLRDVRELVNNKVVVKANIDDGSLEKIVNRIKHNKTTTKTKKTIPFFLKIEDIKSYDALPEEIKSRYASPEFITNYENQGDKITLVRKDYKDILMGHKREYATSADMKNLRKIEKVYRKLIVLFKMRLAILGPSKLAGDIASNTGILMAVDVPLDTIYSGTKEALKYMSEMSVLRNKYVSNKMKAYANPNSKLAERNLEKSKKDVENHPFYPALKNGFIQSMGTDLAMQEFDSIGGLQKDIDNLIGKVARDKDGSLNVVGRTIMGFANLGYGVEDVMLAAVKFSNTNKTSVGTEVIEIAKRIKKLKSKNDVEAYLSNILATPNSEMIKAGSTILQGADITAKWVAYNHFLKQGLSEQDAVQKAMDLFIDYRINLPKEVEQLSSLGILLFPNFWMKAQRSIYVMVKGNPVSSLVPYAIENQLAMLGAPVSGTMNILNVNLYNRYDKGLLISGGQADSLMLQPYF